MEGFTHERRAHRLNGADSGHERAVYQPPEARLTGTATFQRPRRPDHCTRLVPPFGGRRFQDFPEWPLVVATGSSTDMPPDRPRPLCRSARSRSSMARVGFGAASRAYMSSARNARSRSGSRIATGSRRDPPPSVRSAGDRGKPLGEAAVSDGAGLALRRDRGARPEVGWRPRTLLTLFVQPTIAPAGRL